MYERIISNIRPLGFDWQTSDLFLFCVHHLDHYPVGNEWMGPDTSLEGRNIGQDFTPKDVWRMYHGESIPGFPAHPHRGFETVTVVLEGNIDHSDSHGAAGRYSNGDVQWMTAGAGLQHSEMFPLTNRSGNNRLELFQIWLNLPRIKKIVEPHYKMLWTETIPKVSIPDNNGNKTIITIIAGKAGETNAPDPAPDSWAANPDNRVSIWLIKMEAGAKWTIPADVPEVTRSLFFYKGGAFSVAGVIIPEYHSLNLLPEEPVVVQNGPEESLLLLLQGRPIDEPVVQHGPFVMNSNEEIFKAFEYYRNTRFGGWPWPRYDMVHPKDAGRFAKYSDGNTDTKY
jgi:hypothetical protein